MGMDDLLNALIDRYPGTDGKNQDRHHEGPEIELRAIAERMAHVRRLLGFFDAVEQKPLIARVDQGMDAFRQHGGGTGVGGGRELGDRYKRIARKSGINHLFRAMSGHQIVSVIVQDGDEAVSMTTS